MTFKLSGFATKARDKCHNVLVALANERNTAPTQLRTLTVRNLHDILKFLDGNYPEQLSINLDHFRTTLDECEAFIQNHGSAIDALHPGPRKTSLANALRHSRDNPSNSVERQAIELSNTLIHHQKVLAQFLLTQFLKRTEHKHEGAPPTTGPPSDTSSEYSSRATPFAYLYQQAFPEVFNTPDVPIEQKLVKFHECFQILRNRYERITSNAAQQHRAPDLVQAKQAYRDLWISLCDHVDLPRDRQPDMPPMNTLLANHTVVSSDICINSERAIATARNMSTSSASEAATERRVNSTAGATPQSAGGPSLRRQPSSDSVGSDLPGPAMEETVAKTVLVRSGRRFEATLGPWEVRREGSLKTFVWSGIKPPGTLSHTIPPGTYPVSLHRRLQPGPHHIRFLKNPRHNVTWEDEMGILHVQQENPKYNFETEARHDQFQTEVRGKRLAKLDHIDCILTDRRPDGDGEASVVVLKIWEEERGWGREFSITYLRTEENDYADFPLAAFSWPAKMINETTVELTSLSHAGSAGGTHRKSSFLGIGIRRSTGSSSNSAPGSSPWDEVLGGLHWIKIQFASKTEADKFLQVTRAMERQSSNPGSPHVNPNSSPMIQSEASSPRARVLSTPIYSSSNLGGERQSTESPSPRTRARSGSSSPDVDPDELSRSYFDKEH